MRVGDLVSRDLPEHLAPPDVGVHGAADDRSGAHDRDLHGQVVQVPGERAPEHLDLGPALDLEEPHGVARADPVVDGLVLEVDPRQVGRLADSARAPPPGDQVDALLDRREHAEREEVDLDEARVLARVLVPLAEHPALPGGRLEGDDLHEGAARDDHPAHVLRDVPGEPRDVLGQLAQQLPELGVAPVLELGERGDLVGEAGGRAVLGQLGKLLELPERQLERLADLAHGRLEPVSREGAYQSCMFVPVLLVDPQDQLLPDVAREVEVDVGNASERLVEEAAEEEVVLDRVDVREPDQVADDRGDRGTAPPPRGKPRAGPGGLAAHLAADLGGELHDVPVDQEEARQPVQVDQAELGVQPLLGVPLRGAPRLVQLRDPGEADLGERLQRASPLRALEVGELVAQILGQVERGAPLGDEKRVRERLGAALEAMAHLPG